ncbi:MAG TPA: guanylate kinase [Pyrinomonadaceae bacterium]|jgi:guanylate kinase|nr:guanylate kinase [Pyrinomonadaceae bacterium]
MLSKVTELQTPTQVNNSPTRGTLFVVSSPSGGGKGTLVRGVLEIVENLSYSVSYTTRGPRANEVNGREYFFIDVPTFEEMVAGGEFLEWACVHGNFYGTSKQQIAEKTAAGLDIILEVDVQGAASVRQLLMDTVSVFILPPSFAVLKERLCARGTDTAESLELRLRNAPEELKHYSKFDYVIINDEIERAVGQLASIIYAERARCVRRDGLVRRVIEDFQVGG